MWTLMLHCMELISDFLLGRFLRINASTTTSCSWQSSQREVIINSYSSEILQSNARHTPSRGDVRPLLNWVIKVYPWYLIIHSLIYMIGNTQPGHFYGVYLHSLQPRTDHHLTIQKLRIPCLLSDFKPRSPANCTGIPIVEPTDLRLSLASSSPYSNFSVRPLSPFFSGRLDIHLFVCLIMNIYILGRVLVYITRSTIVFKTTLIDCISPSPPPAPIRGYPLSWSWLGNEMLRHEYFFFPSLFLGGIFFGGFLSIFTFACKY